ncbi:MAG: VOC family protein [Dehalococcoidia bacterium]
MIKPKALGHIVLKVRDLERAEKFYTQVLGLRVTGRLDTRMVFLSAGDKHHDLALYRVGPRAKDAEQRQVGLLHFAWELESFDELKRAYTVLKEKGVPIVGAMDHGISKGVYFLDPDGNEIEVYADNPREEWEKLPNPFGGNAPVRLDD